MIFYMENKPIRIHTLHLSERFLGLLQRKDAASYRGDQVFILNDCHVHYA